MMKKLIFLFFVGAIFIFSGCQARLTKGVTAKRDAEKISLQKVVLGIENFLTNYKSLVKGKRVALLTNPSGVDSRLKSTADILFEDKTINLTALFGPEHGIRGAIYAGEHVKDEIDPHTGLPVFSLYGAHKKPTKKMLENVDVILVDIQDIGLRGYTYIYTMALVMEAAAESGKQVIVLDRPNPIDGIRIEGNLVEKGFESFVGLYPIPYRHGMTIGELARYFNQEFDIHCDLQVVPMVGWTRDMLWDQTGLLWVPTSPHVPHWKTILYMGATGTIGELRTISEGVGYTSPFELVGAPWIDGYDFARELNALNLPGVIFRPLYFKPYYASYKGEVCQGVQLHITNPHTFNSYQTGLYILQTLLKLYPQHDPFKFENRVSMFQKIIGCNWIIEDLKAGHSVSEIALKWQDELEQFKMKREKYLMY
ncbi:exo-beta-N-acetylmuramidase NamZ family protein [Calditrichota bacterium GD2]